MKDIPMFTTESGIASLMLQEIPYRKQAYVRVRDVQQGKLADLLAECISFCRMVGAETVFAGDHEELEGYPLQWTVLEMRGTVLTETDKIANLFPVTETTVTQWRQHCNSRLAGVDGAATLTAADEKKIFSSTGAYFVHRDGELLGGGWLDGNKLLTLWAEVSGAGETVLRTLLSLRDGEQALLEVASTNNRAIRLYERLGFVKTREIQKWYKIF